MNHLDYYDYQTKARRVKDVADIKSVLENSRGCYERIVAPWLPADREAPIAELACGHGGFLLWLGEEGYRRTTGVDSSEVQIELAHQVCDRAEIGEAISWLAERNDESLATIVAIDFVEHIPKDAFMELLHLSRQKLMPGGKLILRLPNGGSPFVGLNLFNDITHIWTYTPNCLETLGRMHGLEVARFEDESIAGISKHRWLRVPLAMAVRWLLVCLTRTAFRIRYPFWSPHLWACLGRSR